jgi:hypothetical protein
VTDPIWLEEINRNIQVLLAKSEQRDREIEVRSRPDLTLEIAIDGEIFQGIDEITDVVVQDLIRAAVDEWQNETKAAALVRGTLPAQYPTPSRSRAWMVSWLAVMILIFVLPPLFVTPVHMATRFSLVCAGAMLGGLAGVFAGRAIAQRVTRDGNPKAWMLGGQLGGILGIPIGLIITVGVLSLIP